MIIRYLVLFFIVAACVPEQEHKISESINLEEQRAYEQYLINAGELRDSPEYLYIECLTFQWIINNGPRIQVKKDIFSMKEVASVCSEEEKIYRVFCETEYGHSQEVEKDQCVRETREEVIIGIAERLPSTLNIVPF